LNSYADVTAVTLNRPKALNALSSELFNELNDALTKYDQDKDIGAIIITGSEKAFAGKHSLSTSQSSCIISVFSNNLSFFPLLQPVPTSRRWPR